MEEQPRQTIIKSEAEAKAIQIKANALAQNAKLVECEAIMHWDGKLPEYMVANAMPFINIK